MIQRQIDIGLSDLKEMLITMAGFVEEAINYAILAWKNRDETLLSQVHTIEDKVNQLHKDVDSSCLKLLATQQPMAIDLRFVMSIIKINTDLERMVDQAVNIARTCEYYLKYPELPEMDDLSSMSDDVRFMVREAIDAFVKNDNTLATNVLKLDDKVDNFKDKIFHDMIDHIKKKPRDTEQGLNVILIARNLERIGDHATNIAEDVIFTVSGEDVRHSGAPRTPQTPSKPPPKSPKERGK